MFSHLRSFGLFLVLCFILPLPVAAASPDNSGLFQTPISLSGSIRPAETLKVQSGVGGRVSAIHVKENQTVAKDQLLLTLENDSQKRQLELSRLQLKINENNVKDRERQVELAKAQVQVNENNVKDRRQQLESAKIQIEVSTNNVKDLETNLKDIELRLEDEKTLFEQGSSTRSQLDALQLQYSRGELALKNAKLGLKRAKQEVSRANLGVDNSILTLERSKEDVQRARLGMKNASLTVERSKEDVALREESLKDTRLKAKIGGVISGKFVETGEVINAGTMLFQIINIRQVEIGVQVDEDDLAAIRIGQKIIFTTPGYRNEQFPGTVERIAWAADAQSGRFPFYIKAENPHLKLRSGMSVKVYLLRK